MGTNDTYTKDYMSENKIFADAFNQHIYAGKQMIDPSKLHELDTTLVSVPYGPPLTGTPVQRFRDELKYLSAKHDDHLIYLLLGIENQSNIHYAMPVKNMVYDSLQYATQIQKASASYRKNKSANTSDVKISSAEYLSGFRKEDKLIPIITLVIYFGADPWDAPRSIYDMLSVQDQTLLSYIPDYKINLIAPFEMSDEEINQFSTNLREVMLYLKYSKDKIKLSEIVSTNENFKHIDIKAARVINGITRSNFKWNDKEEEIDMCEAIKGLVEDARNEGEMQGKIEGKIEGRLDSQRETASRMLRRQSYSLEEIADICDLDIEMVLSIQESLKL